MVGKQLSDPSKSDLQSSAPGLRLAFSRGLIIGYWRVKNFLVLLPKMLQIHIHTQINAYTDK